VARARDAGGLDGAGSEGAEESMNKLKGLEDSRFRGLPYPKVWEPSHLLPPLLTQPPSSKAERSIRGVHRV